jgi:hypothetical protein
MIGFDSLRGLWTICSALVTTRTVTDPMGVSAAGRILYTSDNILVIVGVG